jgi:hypothetical protein
MNWYKVRIMVQEGDTACMLPYQQVHIRWWFVRWTPWTEKMERPHHQWRPSAALACDSSARGGRVPSDVAAFNPGVAMGVTCSCSVLKVLGATLLSHALPDMAISPEDGARV